ncbi:MAG: hypothetical protein RLZZ546_772, partial [Bacteroidota bacterium]
MIIFDKKVQKITHFHVRVIFLVIFALSSTSNR